LSHSIYVVSSLSHERSAVCSVLAPRLGLYVVTGDLRVWHRR